MVMIRLIYRILQRKIIFLKKKKSQFFVYPLENNVKGVYLLIHYVT